MSPKTPHRPGRTPAQSALTTVAARALKEVAIRRAATRERDGAPAIEPDEGLAVISRIIFARNYPGDDAAMRTLNEAGFTTDEALDEIIPAAARRIGELWMADEYSFADTSIASVRLQSLAWRFVEPLRDQTDHLTGAPSVVVTVPEGDTHTLGAVIATGAFARIGAQVRAAMGVGRKEIVEMARTQRIDLIAFSASPSADVDLLRNLIDTLRKGRGCPPIALGGSLTLFDSEAAASVGADLVTTDTAHALTLVADIDNLAQENDDREANKPSRPHASE